MKKYKIVKIMSRKTSKDGSVITYKLEVEEEQKHDK